MKHGDTGPPRGGPHPPRTPAQTPRHRTPPPRTSPRRTYPPPGPGQPHTSTHREGAPRARRARKRRSGTPRTPWRASERDPVHTGRATETRTPRRNPATGKTPTEADPPEPFTRERVPRAPHRTRPPHEPTEPCRRRPSSTHHRRHDDPTDENPRQRGCACARPHPSSTGRRSGLAPETAQRPGSASGASRSATERSQNPRIDATAPRPSRAGPCDLPVDERRASIRPARANPERFGPIGERPPGPRGTARRPRTARTRPMEHENPFPAGVSASPIMHIMSSRRCGGGSATTDTPPTAAFLRTFTPDHPRSATPRTPTRADRLRPHHPSHT